MSPQRTGRAVNRHSGGDRGRLASTFQKYVMRLVVQQFGLQVFNDGLKQTLRLRYQKTAYRSSGETVMMLQNVRNNTERSI